MDVEYAPSATLQRFLLCDDFVRAVVGPVGSGKSSACVLELMRRAAEQAPGHDGVRRSRWAIIRNTYPELRDTTRKTFEQWVPPQVGEWREREFSFHIDRPASGGEAAMSTEILFRALDRPEDVKKLLSLELTGAYINEAREIPKSIFDVLGTRVGRYPSVAQGGPTWFGIWMDSNPWATSSDWYQLFSVDRPPGFSIFEQPDGLGPDAENVENLVAGYYARLCLGKDAEWVDEYVRGKYPRADKGSIFGELVSDLEARGGVCDFEHPSDGVHVNLDLGVSDATALWFWRFNEHRLPDLIDWYEASGKPMSHFFEIIAGRGWNIRKIWLPHDARARTFQTGVSTLQLFLERFGASVVSIVPSLSLEDGIRAARWLLEQRMRIHSRCAGGLKLLRAYRYAWDPVRMVFTKKPVHDGTSHSSDSFRYIACSNWSADLTTRPAEKPKDPALPPAATLDSLWAANRPSRKGRM